MFSHTQEITEFALAEARASFSGFRSFRIVFPLQRWPHFRASARSESCSRCSVGLISALPLDPNRAPAAALTSFPVPCHGMQCNTMLRSAARCHAFSCCYDMQRLTTQCHAMLCHSTPASSTQCYAMLCYVPLCDAMLRVAILCGAILHYATPRHAMTYYALPCSSTPCYAVLYHAARTFSGSLPCSTSDCANIEEIYAMGKGWEGGVGRQI